MKVAIEVVGGQLACGTCNTHAGNSAYSTRKPGTTNVCDDADTCTDQCIFVLTDPVGGSLPPSRLLGRRGTNGATTTAGATSAAGIAATTVTAAIVVTAASRNAVQLGVGVAGQGVC
ncbi:hypothetical protein Acsp01_30270 [Actinoplanes sp. NBRC 101535]|nr:hypothetical protein Acsp01_30270 [Actinoplanes sp. NBRC 101535]